MRGLRWLVIVAIAAYLATGIVQVRPGEVAVVRRFGRIVATPGPGLWVGLPWGIDRVDRVAIDHVRRVSVGGDDTEPILTGDQNLVQIRAAVEYTVRPERVAQYVAERERIDECVSRAAEAALAEWAAGRAIDDALLTGKATLPRWLAARVVERLEPYRLGIDVRLAGVMELSPPEEVRGAFDTVTRAQASIRTREQEAEQEAERLRQAAQATKYAQEQQSAAVAHATLEAAKADADAFHLRLKQYRESKATNANVLAALWWAELGPLFAKMQAAGRVQLLDERLGADGLDVLQGVPGSKP